MPTPTLPIQVVGVAVVCAAIIYFVWQTKKQSAQRLAKLKSLSPRFLEARLISHNRRTTATALPQCFADELNGNTTPKAHERLGKRGPQAYLRVDGDSFSYEQNHRATNLSLLPPFASYTIGDIEGMSEVLHKKARFGRWKERRLKMKTGPDGFVLMRSKSSAPMDRAYDSFRSWRRTAAAESDRDFSLSMLSRPLSEDRDSKSIQQKRIDVRDIRSQSIYACTRLKTQSILLHSRQMRNKGASGSNNTLTRRVGIAPRRSEALVAVHQLWHFQMKDGRMHSFRSSSQRQAMSWCNAIRKAITYSKHGLDTKKLRAITAAVEKRDKTRARIDTKTKAPVAEQHQGFVDRYIDKDRLSLDGSPQRLTVCP